MSDSQRTDGAPTNDWFCPKCNAYLCGQQVTNDEHHATCGSPVYVPNDTPASSEGREEFEIYERIRTQVCANCGNDKSAHTPYPAKKPDKMKPLGIEPIAWICPEHACSSRLRNFKMLNHDQVEAFINFLLASRASDRERVKELETYYNNAIFLYQAAESEMKENLARAESAESRVAELQRELDGLAGEVGKALLVRTLAPGEKLADPGEHAIVHAMLAFRAERDNAESQLSTLTGLLTRALATMDERAFTTTVAPEFDELRAAIRSHLSPKDKT